MYEYSQDRSKLSQVLMTTLVVGLTAISGCDSDIGQIDTSLTVSTVPAGGRLRIRDAADVGFTSPVAEAVSDSGFFWNQLANAAFYYPLCGVPTLWHPGLDINILGAGGASDAGTRVYAITDGVVIDRANINRTDSSGARVCDGRDGTAPRAPITEWGSITVLFYYDGVSYVYEYGHMQRIDVGIGDVVRLGQELGEMGEVGAPGAYHLHFEIRTMDHVCHDGAVGGYCRDNLGLVRSCTERADHRPSLYFCDLLVNRRDVTRMYQNPIEFLVSRSMDQYAEDTVGLSALGAAVIPSVLAYPADTGTNSNPSSLARQDIAWLRGGSVISASDLRDALVREYRPSVWGGSPGYLVFPVNHGASHPYWVRSAIGARWHELATSSVVANRGACGMPITGEYLNCPDGVRPCASVRQDFQTCYLTWQAGRDPELSGATAYLHGSPGAYANTWGRAAPDAPRETTAHAYGTDDAGYRFAEAYERNGAHVRLGDPTGPAHALLDARYHAQVFSGGSYGRALIVFDPENRIVSSRDPTRLLDRTAASFIEAAYDRVMTIARDTAGNPVSVVYGDRVQAHLIRTGFLDWYEANDGIRLVGAPLNDEYRWSHLDSGGRFIEDARQDFESGNCLIWHLEGSGSGLTYCGAIIGEACVGWESYTRGCPRVSSIHIDGGSGRPVDLGLPPPASGGPDRGGGGSEDPDASVPAPPPDAGTPTLECSVDTDCPAYGSGWRCRSGSCREVDIDGDGVLGSDGDCNIEVARIHRDAVESCDFVDEDCDGRVDETFDLTSDPRNCGVCGRICPGGEVCSAGSCVTPCSASPEVCGDGIDNNCDGRVNEGCAPVCTPVAEVCDGRDQDCDGRIDEGITPIACSTACSSGTRICVGGSFGTCSARAPSSETCNGLDDDCDGTVDEGVCAPACVPTSSSRDICDGRDNDCDGTVDNGCPAMSPYLVEIWMDPSMLDDCPDSGGFRINLWGPGGIVLRNEIGQPFRRTVNASWLAATPISLSCSVAPTWHDWTGHVGEPSSLNGVLVMRLGGRDMLPTSLVCDDLVDPRLGAKPYLPLESRYEGSCTPRW